MLVLFLQYFFVVAITIAGKSARDTYFLSRYNKSYLPLMFAVCAVSVAIAAAVYSRVSRRLGPTALHDTPSLLFLAGLLLLRMRLQGPAIPVLYVWIEITVAIITLSFWLAASEMFDPRQAKRLFGLIGAGGALAAIVVGSAVKPCVKAFGSESLLWLVAGSLVSQWALGRYSLRFAAAHAGPTPRAQQKPSGRRFDSYLVAIALVVSLSAIASQIVDYQFKMFASEAIPSEVNLASFFGHFYAYTGAATLLFQFFLTATLLTRFGLLAGLVTLPLFLDLSALAVLFHPVLASATMGKFSDQTLKFTLNNSAWELLWLPVPSARRKAVRPVISGTIKYVAESSAGLCVFFLVGITGLRYLSLVAIAAVTTWILIAFRLRALYVKALVAALEKRQVDFEDLSLDAQDPALLGVIEKTLNSTDEAEQLLALELLEGLPLQPWSAILVRSFDGGSNALKQKILRLTAGDPDIISDDRVLASLSADGPLALEAIRAAGARKLSGAENILSSFLQSPNPEVQAASATVLLEQFGGERTPPVEVLNQLIDSSDAHCRVAALPHLASHEDILPPALLSTLLRDPSREVRESALRVAASRRDTSLIVDVIACLDDPRTAHAAQEVLQALSPAEVVPHLDRALRAAEASPRRKVAILQSLTTFPAASAVPLLLASVSPEDLEAASQAVRSLRAMANAGQLPDSAIAGLKPLGPALVRRAYYCNRMLRLLSTGPSNTVLRNDLDDQVRQTIPIVLGVEMISSRDNALADAVTIASDGDPAKLPLLLELLDNVLAQDKRASLSPLIEPMPVEERDAAGAKLYSDLPNDVGPELRKAIYSPREWESAVTLDYVWRAGDADLLATVNWEAVRDFHLTREIRAVVKGQLPRMFSTLEKTILLKSVSLFADIPVEKLAKIAQIAEEVRMPHGTAVMREGEFGDSLFIVADGTVRVHKAGQNLALLKKGDCVGEMALLDHAPRSADVTVEEDAALLRIGREDFNEVTAMNPEIMQGIVRLLVRRLREANEKVARLSAGTSKEGGPGGKQ